MTHLTVGGHLKIYLGYAPGVGKTYQMLEDARALTARGIDLVIGEMQMVAAIVEGSSNREMAQKFNVREDTVKHHLTSIFAKLGVSTRLELALFAIEHRLVAKARTARTAGA